MPSPSTPPKDSVSVVVPCYNVEAYVERAVASALRQSAPPREVICVDDGSTDGTLAVLRRLEAAHPAVRVLTGPNAGAPAARNRGLAEAAGTYVQFLDADDTLDAGKLAAQVTAAERTGADLVAGGYRYANLGGESKKHSPGGTSPWLDLLDKRLGITSANLWHRGAVEDVGGWDEALASSQETDLMLRLLANGATVAYDFPIRTTVHAREGSISSTFSGPNQVRYVQTRARALAHCEAHDLLTERERVAARESLFKSIRALYAADRSAALDQYRASLPSRYVPPVSAFNTRPYVVLCRLVGFDGAERLRSALLSVSSRTSKAS